MKIYLYIQDGGDGSSSIKFFKSEEDRQKQEDWDEKNMGMVVDQCSDYTLDTDNIKWDEPPEDDDDDEEDEE